MVVDCQELIKMLGEIKKKFNLHNDVSVDDLCKKIENNNAYYTFQCKEIDVMNPSVKTAFFIKNCAIVIKDDAKVDNKFDKDMITSVRLIKNRVHLLDINGNRAEVNKDDVRIKNKPIPLELFMNVLQ